MNIKFNTVSVIGLGYIGLPTAAMIASREIHVLGIDINTETVATVNAGKVHIIEPDLDLLVRSVVNAGFLRAFVSPQPADAFLITVPTPFHENHEPDLSYVEAAVRAIAPVLQKGNLIILESTSPVGTTEKISELLASLRSDLTFPHEKATYSDIHIAYCPERVMPGHIIRELIANDRIIGGMTEQCSQKAKALYKLFVEGNCLTTNSRTAEMTKLTENAFRDVNIAFANELSMICEKLKINVWDLIKLANHHPRVNILQPGPGVGGHCIAVDPWFIVNAAPEEAKLIRTARIVNNTKPQFVLEKIKTAAGDRKRKIACLGLAYKANTDDLRESPAIEIMQQLAIDHDVLAVEPHIEVLPTNLAKKFKLYSLEQAMHEADIFVLLVNHNEFAELKESDFAGKIFINVVSGVGLQKSVALLSPGEA